MGEFTFIEKERIQEGTIVFDGLPDTGLVGTIAALHLVSVKKIPPAVRIDSDFLPPIAIVKDMNLFEPLMIYSSGDLSILASEVPIPTEITKPFAKELVSWIKDHRSKAVISIGGIAEPTRSEIEDPAVFYLTNAKQAFSPVVDLEKIKPLDSAFLVGPKAAFLVECFREGVATLGLFAQSFSNYPDPGAAASALNALRKLPEFQVDLGELVKSGEEMRVRFRDLMRRTMGEMERAQKSREMESPSLLV